MGKRSLLTYPARLGTITCRPKVKSLLMTFPQSALLRSGRQVIVRGADQGGALIKLRVAAWRPERSNPSGRGCLPAGLRHHSVVYRHTLLRSSLSCAQTALGAGYWNVMSRL